MFQDLEELRLMQACSNTLEADHIILNLLPSLAQAYFDNHTPNTFLHVMQAYSNNLVDHHIILDLLPSLAQAYFSNHIPANLSYLQAAILLSLGLQQNDISSLESAIQLPPNQALALFNKVMLLATSHT